MLKMIIRNYQAFENRLQSFSTKWSAWKIASNDYSITDSEKLMDRLSEVCSNIIPSFGCNSFRNCAHVFDQNLCTSETELESADRFSFSCVRMRYTCKIS